ncbi:MAG: arylsulfatase [Candidatus Marinimicrobia bacterium]|jgi:arylsulfatase A-like enzyme|nr:arylsulfatase [Candidatus Neomarinimicrobiota bacterium]MBT3823585.1 arylsulfatase [Candidatus Neomarinimicrobiota bacterium]MBT4129556.1 arylsulfatase [Candidatus Neomarinimicrobiota bacterium]MBT4295918.1 arylsulfatase [Candidatus Neomarinimicrobiota bacterium]MBT4420080.1 arylsulfatase [Candidatus Neomarinimicrobiota bacterium]
MKRREFLKVAGIGTLGLVACVPPSPKVPLKSGKHPNIIYILADDLGYGDVSCLNPESRIQTPHIDQLAANGINFTDAHSNSGVCTPTRYGVLAGRYTWRTKLKRGVLKGHSKPLIPTNRLTVPALLRQSGYATACIGKWHLGMDWPTKDGEEAKLGLKNVDFNQDIQHNPLDLGFDYYYGISGSLGMPPHVFIENRRVVEEPTIYVKKKTPEAKQLLNGREGWMVEGWDIHYVLPRFRDKAVEYIKDHTKKSPEQPFFMYLPLNSPHKPIAPNKEFLGKSEAGEYGDFVMETDHAVGQVVKAVQETGIADNTLIIFTSDNGPERIMYAIHKEFGHDGSAQYRGCKRDNWDGGHRIPFFATWPGTIQAGHSTSELICLTDMLATCAEITDQELPDNAGEDSVSILPALKGINSQPIREAVVHHSAKGFFAIRQGDWKLLLHDGSGGNKYPDVKTPPIQLYNMRIDETETQEFSVQNPEIVNKLAGLMKQYITNGRSTAGSPQSNDGEEDWRQIDWMKNY